MVPDQDDTALIEQDTGVNSPWTVTVTNQSVGTLILEAGEAGTLSVSGLLDATSDIFVSNGILMMGTSATLAVGGALTLGALGSSDDIFLSGNDELAAASLNIYDGSVLNLGTGSAALLEIHSAAAAIGYWVGPVTGTRDRGRAA